jgi:hypothetical protein
VVDLDLLFRIDLVRIGTQRRRSSAFVFIYIFLCLVIFGWAVIFSLLFSVGIRFPWLSGRYLNRTIETSWQGHHKEMLSYVVTVRFSFYDFLAAAFFFFWLFHSIATVRKCCIQDIGLVSINQRISVLFFFPLRLSLRTLCVHPSKVDYTISEFL